MKTQLSIYRRRLIAVVLKNSVSESWNEAVEEWLIINCEEDESQQFSCVCGKEELRYLYTIKNRCNGKVLSPIGSSCIKTFGRADLNEETKITEQLFRLLNALQKNEFITLSPELFSRKLLTHLYEKSVFDIHYNDFDGYSDYKFMMKMFNKRKENITYNQQKKISAIVMNAIFPYLQSILKIRSLNQS